MWTYRGKLLAVPDLTLTKALEIAQESEAAVKTMKYFKEEGAHINTF